MTVFPNHPFEPGFGVAPPYRGPRPEVESALSDILDRMRSGARGSHVAFLYGPRGNGKTVLLHWLRAEAAASQTATAVLDIESLKSPVTLIRSIRAATRRFSRVWERTSLLRAECQGFDAGLESADAALPLANVLKRGKGGIVLTLDEAHEAPPEMLGLLLRGAQVAGESRSVAVVFVGTPGLEATLRAAHASFWSRGEKLRIGLLEDGSARDMLSRPFRDAGLKADDGAIAELATAADNYPYVLQLYGRAAWRVAEASGGRSFLPEHVAPTLKAANGERLDCYRDRCEKFREAGLLPLARRVAEAFVESAAAPADRRLTDAAFNKLLACDGSRDHRRFLIAKGDVWQDSPETLLWTPGIPSLLDYMLARVPSS